MTNSDKEAKLEIIEAVELTIRTWTECPKRETRNHKEWCTHCEISPWDYELAKSYLWHVAEVERLQREVDDVKQSLRLRDGEDE